MSEQDLDQIEELGADDLLDEEDGPGAEPRANRTLKMDRNEFNRAQALAAQFSPTIPPAPITSPILDANPRPAAGQPARMQPASISPVAIDTNPLPTLPPPPRVPQVMAGAPYPSPKKASALPWILGAAAVFVFVAVGGSIAGYMVVSRNNESTQAANAPPAADRDPKTAEVDHAGSSNVDTTPKAAPAKADQGPQEVPTMNVGSLPTAPAKGANVPAAAKSDPSPKPVVVAKADPPPAPAPPPPPAAKPVEPTKPAPAAAKPQATTGVIRVPEGSKALTVVVDGGYHRLNDQGMAVVKCGHHSVRAGSSTAQEIDVPCGGMVTIQ